ncbi:vam6 Vps39, partial [Olea europaea subsp. europaea]
EYTDITAEVPDLSRGSSGISDDMESSPSLHVLDSEEIADLESKKMSHNMLMALI